MPITQKTVILNAFGSGTLERRERTSSSGKTSDRWTVTLDAKPLVLDFDTKRLGQGPALAIAAHLRDRVSKISATASPSTQLKRKYAATAIAAGKSWANKRYAGGRIGALTPNQSPRLFNDSGRFVRGLIANPTRDNNWVINVAANRLNAAQLGGEAALIDLVNRLRVYVPEFGSAAELLKVPAVQHAILVAVDAIHNEQAQAARASSGNRELGKELIKLTLAELGKNQES